MVAFLRIRLTTGYLQAGRLGTAEEEHAKRGGGGEGESGRELSIVFFSFVIKMSNTSRLIFAFDTSISILTLI